jgi:hypothetical protein
VRDALRQTVGDAQEAAELMDAWIDVEDLRRGGGRGTAKAAGLMQSLILDLSEELDAYQNRHAR